MSNTSANPVKKPQGNQPSNTSKQDVNPGQKGRENTFDENKKNDRSSPQQKDGGMKQDAESKDTRREREEEDRPRAAK